MPPTLFRSIVLTSLLSASAPAFAADLIPSGDQLMRCDMTLRGIIAPGDKDKVAQAVRERVRALATEYNEPAESFSVTLCLDSPGGALAEGIRLAQLFANQKIATAVARDTRCESACAVAFLGGSYNTWGMDSGHDRQIRRTIHPTARLGFHAPSLTVQDGSYSAESVNKAYGVALAGIGALQKLKQQIYITDALMTIILTTPSDSMTYLETVQQSAAWHIQVAPTIAPAQLTREVIMQACINMNRAAPKAAGAAVSLRPELRADDIDITDANPGDDYVFVQVDATYRYPGNVQCSFGWQPPHADYPMSMLSGTLDVFMRVPYAWFSAGQAKLTSIARQNDYAAETTGSSASRAKSAQAQCLVLRGGAIRDQDPCTLTRTNQGLKDVLTFTWPSGAKTVVERTGSTSKINGTKTATEGRFLNKDSDPAARATITRAAAALGAAGNTWRCWLNSSSGNRFCAVDPRQDGDIFD